MLKPKQLILRFLLFVQVIIYPRELVEYYIIVLLLLGFNIGELRQYYALNRAIEVKVDVIKLSNSVSNSFTIDP